MTNNLFKSGIPLSILGILLSSTVSFSGPMNEPDEDDYVCGRQSTSSTSAIDSSELVLHASPSTVVDVITPEIKRTYLPTQERGVPDYYEIKVSKEEWDDAVSKISTGLKSGITGYGDDIVAQMLSDWKKVSDNFCT